uniref:IS4 family transposase n=1 Tax=Deinococcus apachensis TaxID=309886 RepID=UPI00036FB595|nr:IS4 family transposase [Deinococcus apachensis]
MKNTRSRPPQSSLCALLAQHFPLDPRRLTVLSALILAVIQARSVVLYQLVQLIDLPGSDETVYQRLRGFVQFALPDLLVARFVLAHLHDEQHWLLVLDRTNWKLGQHDINILLLSVRWQSFSFPLVWTLLPHSGNSTMTTRIALVERLLPLLQGRRVFLTADREFIGSEWFVALRRMNLSPVIRLRADSVVEGSPVWVRFKKMRPGELRVWYKPVQVYGVTLRVLACQNASRETLFLAYQGHAGPALKRYALRWTAENMHQALKSRGFFLESTHLTNPARVSTLLAVVALAFVWCCLIGEFEQQRDPSRCLRHGYPPKSLFRRGLDALRAVLSKPRSGFGRAFPLFLAPFDP